MSNPSYENLAYLSMKADVKTCRDLNVGQKALRNSTYLPQFDGESDTGYTSRIALSYLKNKFNEKIDASIGLVLNKPIGVDENVPDYLKVDANNAGETIDQFSLTTLDNGEIDGHSFILVDSPAQTAENLQQQEENNIHPYFINTASSQLINWRFEETVLTLVVIKSDNITYEDEFEEKVETNYSVYRNNENGVTVQIYTVDKNENMTAGEVKSLPFKTIPLVPFYANKEGEFISTPPFLNVANNNINTFQLSSQKQRALKMVGDPDKAIFDDNIQMQLSSTDEKGVTESTLTFGADIAQVFGTDARYEFVEPTGKGVELLTVEIDGIEKHIEGLGAELTQQTNITATEAEISNTKATSADVQFSRNLEDALNAAYQFIVQADTSAPAIEKPFTLNTDFAKSQLDANTINTLNTLVLSNNLTRETMLKSISEGKLPRFTTEEQINEEIGALETINITDE